MNKAKLIDHAKFVVQVAAAIAAIYLVQTKLMKVPVVGEWLPGGNA